MRLRAIVQGRLVSSAVFWWAAAGASVQLLAGAGAAPADTQLWLSSLGLLHSAMGFWSDGRQRITAPGIYFFAAGLFIYFPGIYLIGHDPISHGAVSVLPALTFCYFAQLFMYYVVWRPRDAGVPDARVCAEGSVTAWGMWVGLLVAGAGIALSVAGFGNEALVNGTAFSGVVLMAVSLLRREKKLSTLGYLLIGAAFVAYLQYVFSGFGRLQLGALALCVVMTAAHRWRGRAVKVALLVGIGPGLMYLAQSRVAFTATLNPAQRQSVNGLESVLSPLVRFAQLWELDAAGQLAHTWGASFFSSLVVLVPRQLWPDKPIGFGAELAHLFRPDLDGTGYSEAALLHGEVLCAFGVFGLVAMVPVFAWFVGWLDRRMVAAFSIELHDRWDLFLVVAVTVAGASIVDLFWGGTFTYMSRVAPRLLVLFVVFLAFGWMSKKRSVEPLPFPAKAEPAVGSRSFS